MKPLAKNSWMRLLAGFYLTYESASAGGSKVVNDHLTLVTKRIREGIENPDLRYTKPQKKPVCKHLKDALKIGEYYIESPLYQYLGGLKDYISWEYGYEYLPDDLRNKYAYTEILGPHGSFIYKDLVLGLVLLAPDSLYPVHHHDGIEESYICLGGVGCYNDYDVLSTNTLVYVPPGQSHKISTDSDYPLLLSYAWVGSREKLMDQKMKFD